MATPDVKGDGPGVTISLELAGGMKAASSCAFFGSRKTRGNTMTMHAWQTETGLRATCRDTKFPLHNAYISTILRIYIVTLVSTSVGGSGNMESYAYDISTCDRKLREVPYLSRYIILENCKKKPRYMAECPGTPRRPYDYNTFDRIRYKPTFNPYVKLNKDKKYRLDNWESRNHEKFSPLKTNSETSIPPCRKSKPRWSPIRHSNMALQQSSPKRRAHKNGLFFVDYVTFILSGRYRADVEKQYYMHDLPWVWHKNFFTGVNHFCDNMVIGKKKWYRKEQQKDRMKEAMKKINDLVLEYREVSNPDSGGKRLALYRECKNKKKYNFLEKVVSTLGEEIAHKYIRKIKNIYL
ncbi:conserved Plasmodium protein, unknown function [Plasmodium ovale curtisi]|uniref:Uncharacterized protein n=1 Tax=Plasmodium ovale curtisi TaxID=864141 RepID=A0A1A8VL50_PLAOA|nr:conserved Plasmodium protein, unknown function [Plasmodium ovale curtisi]